MGAFDDLPKEIRDRIEAQSRREEIWCPYCKTEQSQETKYHHVSYWGEDGSKPCSCGECGQDFFVKEQVERTFKTFRANPDKDEEGYEGN